MTTMMMMIWMMKLMTHVYMKKMIAELQQSQHKSRRVRKLTSNHALFSNLYGLQTIMLLTVSLLFLKQVRQEDHAFP